MTAKKTAMFGFLNYDIWLNCVAKNVVVMWFNGLTCENGDDQNQQSWEWLSDQRYCSFKNMQKKEKLAILDSDPLLLVFFWGLL